MICPHTPARERERVVGLMLGRMLRRGPDEGGMNSSGACTLGIRRLAIFDRLKGGQPMQTDRFGGHRIVFNGALYNFRDLRRPLESSGMNFRSDCDTEVLLELLAEKGTKCLDTLRGMYAFAVLRGEDNSLLLARDPLGIKPLFYHAAGERLLFASEIGALLATGLVPAEQDPKAVADYLRWFSIPAPGTLYREIHSVLPGECLRWQAGVLRREGLWNLTDLPTQERCTTALDFRSTLRERLEDSVRAHALADVPVGAFLSGGLDSAAIAALLCRSQTQKLRTFSIIFSEKAYSEEAEAEETARFLGTQHSNFLLTGRQVADDMEDILATMGQPSGDGVNTYYVSQAAREGGVTVALSGLGGDELFGGYPSFGDVPRLARWMKAWKALPGPLRSALLKALQTGGTRCGKLADLLLHGRDLASIACLRRRVFSEAELAKLLAPGTRSAGGYCDPLHPRHAHISQALHGMSPRASVGAYELLGYMADVLLPDSDTMSMRHSLELRVPFLDLPLLSWLSSQPDALRFDSEHPKRCLALALADLLPPTLQGRRKRGFSLPFDPWMRKELRPFLEHCFSTATLAQSGLLNTEAAQHLWKSFASGSDPRLWSRVWSIGVLSAILTRKGRP